MTHINPRSQAQADIVFTKAEREQAALRFLPQLRNVKQRYYRAGRKAAESIEAWFDKTGSPLDLIDFERAAERQQIIAHEMHGVEAHMKRLAGE